MPPSGEPPLAAQFRHESRRSGDIPAHWPRRRVRVDVNAQSKSE
jgi:hypothetical protein